MPSRAIKSGKHLHLHSGETGPVHQRRFVKLNMVREAQDAAGDAEM